MAKLSRSQARAKKHLRVKAKLQPSTSTKPRLNVFKSLQNLEAQLIDDSKGHTLAHINTQNLKLNYGGNISAATKAGAEMGKKIKALGIKEVIFDRGGYIYHGRVKAFADAVRAEGVKF